MPLYFFYISGVEPFSDAEGEELPDDGAAWREAIRTVRDVEWTLDPKKSPHWLLEVKRDGRKLFRIEVSAQRYRF
jgi:hypothetical protein